MGKLKFSKRFVVIVLVLLAAIYWLFFAGYRSAPPGAAIPNKFEVIEKKFTIGTSLEVVANGLSFGNVSNEWYNPFKKSFDFEDQSGETVAHASKAIVSWGTEVDVTDGHGQSIGAMHKKVLSSFLGMGVTNVYEVYDSHHPTPLVSDGIKVGITTFMLREGNGGPVVAQLYKSPWSLFHDSWEVEIYQPGAVDQRILVMIAAFKTAADNDKN
jgi:hypothetical protein